MSTVPSRTRRSPTWPRRPARPASPPSRFFGSSATRARSRWSATLSTTWSRCGADMLRVGRIPYLNCEPFFHRLTGVELVDLIPRRLGEAMAASALDAGPLSLMDYVRLESRLVPLPYGIGCPTGARSVLVFSDRPLAQLAGVRIGVTGETSTSVELLRVLLAMRHVVEPAAWVGSEIGRAHV